MNWKEFSRDPFGFVDKISFRKFGKEWNLLRDDSGNRRVALIAALVALGAWIVLGWDSTPLQFIHVIYEGLPAYFAGEAGLAEMVGIYNSYYGKEMHYSAFVIYLLLYWAVSKNLSRIGVNGARNVLYSFSAMFLSIAVFEWFWIYGFSVFQGQAWVSSWRWPQMRILLQNLAFTALGLLGLIYCWLDSYIIEEKPDPGMPGKMTHEITGRNWRFRVKSPMLWILLVLAVVSAIFWIYYPGPIEQISVPLETGEVWQSSRLFPQTLYTIDLNPLDAENAGVWFYVQNDLIHGVNTGVKAIWALLIYQVFRVKGKNNE